MQFPRTAVSALTAGLLAIAFGTSACDTDTVDEEEQIAGAYQAIEFTLMSGGESIDVLGAGGFIEMVLTEGGTATGRIFVPEEIAGSDGNDVTFAGTYSVSGNLVTFDHEEDTFVRDVTWTFANGTLRAETDDLTVVLLREE